MKESQKFCLDTQMAWTAQHCWDLASSLVLLPSEHGSSSEADVVHSIIFSHGTPNLPDTHACYMVPWQLSVTSFFHLCPCRFFSSMVFHQTFSLVPPGLFVITLESPKKKKERIAKEFWGAAEKEIGVFIYTYYFPFMVNYSWHDLWGCMSSSGVREGLEVLGASVCDKLTNSEALCHRLSDRLSF